MGRLALAKLAQRATQSAMGESATITTGVESVTVRAVYSSASAADGSGGAHFIDPAPRITVRVADLDGLDLVENVGQADPTTVTVRGTDYQIRTVKPDGLGGALIVLMEAAEDV